MEEGVPLRDSGRLPFPTALSDEPDEGDNLYAEIEDVKYSRLPDWTPPKENPKKLVPPLRNAPMAPRNGSVVCSSADTSLTAVQDVYDNSLPALGDPATDGAAQPRYLTPSVVVRSLDPDVEQYDTRTATFEETDVDVVMYGTGPSSAHEYEYSESAPADTDGGLYDASTFPESAVKVTRACAHDYVEVVDDLQLRKSSESAADNFTYNSSMDFGSESWEM